MVTCGSPRTRSGAVSRETRGSPRREAPALQPGRAWSGTPHTRRPGEVQPMDRRDHASPPSGEQLSTMETCWTVLQNAHTPGPEGQLAMRDLIGRYHDA